MNLEKIYSLRKNFSIIGLTGRTGAGCTNIANLLSVESINELSIRMPEHFKVHTDFSRKYRICYNYAKENWKPYKIITYKSVLLLHLLRHPEKKVLAEIRQWYPDNWESLKEKVSDILQDYDALIQKIQQLESIGPDLKDEEELLKLGELFFSSNFSGLSKNFYSALDSTSIKSRIIFTHRLANNLRAFGTPLSKAKEKDENYQGYSITNIYTVSETINRLIKGLKNIKDDDVHVVIDCLKSSLEIMFFKERYSGFYMLALNSKDRNKNIHKTLTEKYKDQAAEAIPEIIDLDDVEYRCNDFKKGAFYSPDIQNCIQKSDIHLNSDEEEDNADGFRNLDEYLLKYIALIQQPGIVTPSAVERCMQMAYNAKYNSGCISRQVGAVVTDKHFSIKSIGWNDVPAGSVPCLQRDIRDLIKEEGPDDNFAFSDFERSNEINIGKETKTNRGVYKKEMRKLYEAKLQQTNLQGRSCSFCFKSSYNAFEGNDNQVHTRSLHAEENAMLQIAKLGGVALQGGNLFTTASPCELCSKKAYQLGVKNIYYIDPYPGIANEQILQTGQVENRPLVFLFSGAVGRAYHKLYEPFMAFKDELNMLTDIKHSVSLDVKLTALTNSKDFDSAVKIQLERLLTKGALDAKKLSKIIDIGLRSI